MSVLLRMKQAHHLFLYLVCPIYLIYLLIYIFHFLFHHGTSRVARMHHMHIIGSFDRASGRLPPTEGRYSKCLFEVKSTWIKCLLLCICRQKYAVILLFQWNAQPLVCHGRHWRFGVKASWVMLGYVGTAEMDMWLGLLIMAKWRSTL